MKRSMRDALGAVIALLAATAPAAASAEIYKCVDAGRTAYQSWPCDAPAWQTTIAPPSLHANAAPPASRASPAWRNRSGPWPYRTLTLGMPDDAVLNLAGWGRPDRIVRSPREFREEWIYGEGTGAERRLVFVNARLIEIEGPPATSFAGLPARSY